MSLRERRIACNTGGPRRCFMIWWRVSTAVALATFVAAAWGCGSSQSKPPSELITPRVTDIRSPSHRVGLATIPGQRSEAKASDARPARAFFATWEPVARRFEAQIYSRWQSRGLRRSADRTVMSKDSRLLGESVAAEIRISRSYTGLNALIPALRALRKRFELLGGKLALNVARDIDVVATANAMRSVTQQVANVKQTTSSMR
jgi:hypothetical protein